MLIVMCATSADYSPLIANIVIMII